MPRHRMSITGLLIGVAVAGCASTRTPSTTAQASVAGAESQCPSPAESQEGLAWRPVTAEGFTFCVPAHWRQESTRSWRGAEGSVEWSLALPRPQPVPSLPPRPDGPQYRTFHETIGGERVTIHTVRLGFEFRAFATWKPPTIFFEGDSRNSGRWILLEIFRSVRRAAP